MSSLKERLGAAEKFKSKRVPFMGETVELRSISVGTVRRIEAMRVGTNGKPGLDDMGVGFEFVRECVYDPDTGEKLFAGADGMELLESLPIEQVTPLIEEVNAIAGVGAKVDAQAGKV
jgi:hypothetical protein